MLQWIQRLWSWTLCASLKKLQLHLFPFALLKSLIWFGNSTSRAPQWNVSAQIWWKSANTIKLNRLFNLSFLMLKTHLLGSRIVGGWFVSNSGLLSVIFRMLFSIFLWHNPILRPRSLTRGRSRLHCSKAMTQSRIRVHLPLIRLSTSTIHCRKVSGTSSCPFWVTFGPKSLHSVQVCPSIAM